MTDTVINTSCVILVLWSHFLAHSGHKLIALPSNRQRQVHNLNWSIDKSILGVLIGEISSRVAAEMRLWSISDKSFGSMGESVSKQDSRRLFTD